MASIFSRIMAGEIPGAFVYEDEQCVAFLDAGPQTTGHTLVVPRQEIDHWVDLPSELLAHLMDVAQQIGQAQQKVYDCARIGVLIQGYEVPHVHIHVWPTNSVEDFVFGRREMLGVDDLLPEAKKISAALAQG